MEQDDKARALAPTNVEAARTMHKWGVGMLIAGTVALVIASNVLPFLPDSD